MIDMTETIAPKSDQLNADDLIERTLTITVAEVRSVGGDQPIAIRFNGDDGRPFMPCKSMRRVLVSVWGKDGTQYVGRSMTLYRDPEVTFGGAKVGGIRISHMSHLDRPKQIALTAARGRRAPYQVKPLVLDVEPEGQSKGPMSDAEKRDYFLGQITADVETAKVTAWWSAPATQAKVAELPPPMQAQLETAFQDRIGQDEGGDVIDAPDPTAQAAAEIVEGGPEVRGEPPNGLG